MFHVKQILSHFIKIRFKKQKRGMFHVKHSNHFSPRSYTLYRASFLEDFQVSHTHFGFLYQRIVFHVKHFTNKTKKEARNIELLHAFTNYIYLFTLYYCFLTFYSQNTRSNNTSKWHFLYLRIFSRESLVR